LLVEYAKLQQYDPAIDGSLKLVVDEPPRDRAEL
jgi:hypothetical protein